MQDTVVNQYVAETIARLAYSDADKITASISEHSHSPKLDVEWWAIRDTALSAAGVDMWLARDWDPVAGRTCNARAEVLAEGFPYVIESSLVEALVDRVSTLVPGRVPGLHPVGAQS